MVATQRQMRKRAGHLGRVRGGRASRQLRHGIATIEVVMTTALIIPVTFTLLWIGLRTMRAFLAVLGVSIGSPLG